MIYGDDDSLPRQNDHRQETSKYHMVRLLRLDQKVQLVTTGSVENDDPPPFLSVSLQLSTFVYFGVSWTLTL